MPHVTITVSKRVKECVCMNIYIYIYIYMVILPVIIIFSGYVDCCDSDLFFISFVEK